MLLLISDANILIDVEAAELLETLFKLPYQFAIPDILYVEEIEPGTPGLEQLGLNVLEVQPDFVSYALSLVDMYGRKPSHNDYLALALAKQQDAALLTGDHNLKIVAQKESVQVMGTIWLLVAMVKHGLLSVKKALEALKKMKQRSRRLPWAEAEQLLLSLNKKGG